MKNTSFAVTDDWPHDLSITNDVIDMAEDDALFAALRMRGPRHPIPAICSPPPR